jgi:cytoskeletal protein CcmA (bactofilin family)
MNFEYMFSTKDKDMAKLNETNGVVNLIGVGTTISGDITSSGDIRVDGTLKGSINTKGKVVVGTTGIVEGDVVCQNADVSGELKAKVSVSELLSLKSTAKLDGDIITNKLAIEPGANFSGSCSMGAVIKDINNAGKQESKKQEKTA